MESVRGMPISLEHVECKLIVDEHVKRAVGELAHILGLKTMVVNYFTSLLHSFAILCSAV